MKKLFAILYHYFKSTDRLLIALCMGASAFSAVLLCGIVHSGYADQRRVLVQIAASGMGVIAAIIMSKIDYHLMAKLWKFHAALGYFLVLLTFVFGVQRDDDKAWLPLPFGLTLQPSEFLKISFIVAFALHLQTVRESLNQPKVLLGVCAHGAVPVLLILIQGDAGTAVVFLFIFCAMVFAAGLDWKYMAAAAGAGVVAAPVVWFYVMDEHKRMRFLSVYNWELDPLGVGLQQRYGRRALGSGQIWGKGIFYGKHQYVPEIYNDFIFSFIGEALGFIGCLVVLALLSAIVLRILYTAGLSKDPLGRFICVGVFAMLAVQTVLNVGMCLSLLPVIGITLPFFSAGGTSVVATYLGIGLSLSVFMNNKQNLFSDR